MKTIQRIIDWYNKLQEAFRWILFLPVSIGLSVIFSWLFVFLLSFFGFERANFILLLIQTTTFHYTFMFLVYLTVPRWRIGFVLFFGIIRALGLVVIMVVFPLISLIKGSEMGDYYSFTYLRELFGEVLCLLISYFFYREIKIGNRPF
jgi:hypothetical protein